MVSARLYPDRVCIVAGDAVGVSHERVAERGQVCYDLQHYIPLVQLTPSAIPQNSEIILVLPLQLFEMSVSCGGTFP